MGRASRGPLIGWLLNCLQRVALVKGHSAFSSPHKAARTIFHKLSRPTRDKLGWGSFYRSLEFEESLIGFLLLPDGSNSTKWSGLRQGNHEVPLGPHDLVSEVIDDLPLGIIAASYPTGQGCQDDCQGRQEEQVQTDPPALAGRGYFVICAHTAKTISYFVILVKGYASIYLLVGLI